MHLLNSAIWQLDLFANLSRNEAHGLFFVFDDWTSQVCCLLVQTVCSALVLHKKYLAKKQLISRTSGGSSIGRTRRTPPPPVIGENIEFSCIF